MNHHRLSGWSKVAVAATLVALASCADSGAEQAPSEVGVEAGESSAASALIGRVRDEFVVRPDVPVEAVPGFEVHQEPLLPPSEVESFAREGGALVPRLRSAEAAAKATASVRIGTRASGGFRVEKLGSGFSMNVHMLGANDAPAEIGDGHVVYRDGLGQGVDVIQRARAHGVEDFVRFETAPAKEELAYDVELGDGVAGLRLVADTLELLDATGDPRMRVSPPSVVDANGKWREASLTLDGCAVDTNPAAPWGRKVTAPGASHCTMRVGWSGRGIAYPALVDPNFWTSTASMGTARVAHIGEAISSTKVLVAGGGSSTGGTLLTAEIWNASTGTWAATSSMTYRRYAHGSAVLSPATTVLVAGGFSSATTTCSNPCDQSEIYTVSTGTWGSAATMVDGRYLFGMGLMKSSGTQVIAAGGIGASGNILNHAELYTISTNSWASTGSLTNARYFHTLTALGNSDEALVAGGRTGAAVLDAAELWSGGSWASAGTSGARFAHTASLLTGDDVLLAGGVTETDGDCTNSSEVWSTPTTWTATSTFMTGGSHRCYHSAAVLGDGNVLVAGGLTNIIGGMGVTPLSSVSLYNVGTQTWSAQNAMATARRTFPFTTFTSGSSSAALAAGGENGSGVLSASEYFTH